MAWSNGSWLFGEFIRVLKSEIDDPAKRAAIYRKIIPSFEEQGWDTQEECLGDDPAYAEALYSLHPDWRR